MYLHCGRDIAQQLLQSLGIIRERVRDVIIDVDAAENVSVELVTVEPGNGECVDVTSISDWPFKRFVTRKDEFRDETIHVGVYPGIGLALCRAFGIEPTGIVRLRLLCRMNEAAELVVRRLITDGEPDAVAQVLSLRSFFAVH